MHIMFVNYSDIGYSLDQTAQRPFFNQSLTVYPRTTRPNFVYEWQGVIYFWNARPSPNIKEKKEEVQSHTQENILKSKRAMIC